MNRRLVREVMAKPEEFRLSGRVRDVLDAAANIFHERGYSGATVQAVADELGIMKGSLYYYIETKEDLLYWLLMQVHDDVNQILTQVMNASPRSAVRYLDLYIRRQVEFTAQNVKRIRIYYHNIEELSEQRRSDILRRRRAHEDRISNLIRQAQGEGDVDPSVDAEILSRFVFATIVWVSRWYKPEGDITIGQVSELCARFARQGIGPTQAAN
jgi:TetR/AcrR family transcriptional regulator, cholesterol catabolism regulator